MLARVAVAGAERDRKGADDGPVRLGRTTALLADSGKRGDERLLPLEEAAGSIERLPTEIVEQGCIGHLSLIGIEGRLD